MGAIPLHLVSPCICICNLIVLVASKVSERYPLALGGPLHLSGLRDQHPKWRETSLFSTFEFRQSRFDQVYSDLIVAPEVLLHLH